MTVNECACPAHYVQWKPRVLRPLPMTKSVNKLMNNEGAMSAHYVNDRALLKQHNEYRRSLGFEARNIYTRRTGCSDNTAELGRTYAFLAKKFQFGESAKICKSSRTASPVFPGSKPNLRLLCTTTFVREALVTPPQGPSQAEVSA